MFKHYRESTEDTHARWEGHVPLSHLNIGYWDGLGVYKVVNVEGSEEVVEITYDRKGNRKGKDDLADEMGTESFAVWYRSIGLITLKEANHTLNTADLDANEEGHAGDTSPNEGVDTDASTETSVVPHVHKKFILGNHIDTEIGMARPSTNEGRGTDHVEDKMECRRGQENVTKSADSFEGKAVDKERSGTPSDPPIMVTVRVLLDTADRGTIAAISPSTYTCIANGGEPWGDRELSEMIQERMQHEPEIGHLEFAIAQLCEGENADGPSDTYSQHKQTELTEVRGLPSDQEKRGCEQVHH